MSLWVKGLREDEGESKQKGQRGLWIGLGGIRMIGLIVYGGGVMVET